jgi:glutathione S-transferase
MYTLYYAPGTASLVVHWMLLELGVPFELVRVDLKAERSPEHLRLNPSGQVPVLAVDGNAYSESTALLMLLAERHPEAGLAPAPGSPLRGTWLQEMVWLANGLMPPFRQWFYDGEGDDPGAEAIRAVAGAKIEAAWTRLDERLADGRPFLLGERMTTVDLLATMLTRWSRAMPRRAEAWPRLGAYMDRMRALPSLREVHAREGLTDWIDDRAGALG